MNRATTIFLVVSFLWVQTSLPVLAQSVIEVHGTVTDETGAVILGATVILEGENKKYISTTADLGQYRFLGIKPGAYTLTVQAEGFAKFTKSLNLAKNHSAPENVVLKISINEKAEVRSNDAGVSTEPDKNLSGLTLSGKDLDALPDDPDELLSTLKQMAGASGDANVYVDGFQEGGRLPPKQAIMMIRINSNPFAAEYSESGFARIEIITKPGTSTYHGNLRLNFTDESLNARNSFAPLRAPLQVRNYSGMLNGPISRNRWDFFLDFERREQDENAVVNASVLDATTFEPKTLAQTVLTPSRLTNFSLRTNFLATKNNTLGAWYRHTNNVSGNNGLEGGFDLPERAFDRSAGDDTLRFSLTTIAGEHTVNELRTELSRRMTEVQALSDATAVVVLDSFSSGGNQSSLSSKVSNDNLQLTDNLSYTYQKHTFKFGVRADATHVETTDRSNFGGTFTFGSDFERDASGAPVRGVDGNLITITPIEHYRRALLGLPGYAPSQFTINSGDPFAGLLQWTTAFFAQDDWRLSQKLTLSYGVRQEFQTHLQDKLNLAPRIGIAWAPTKKGTLRAGAGIFYNRLDTGITLDTVRYDGAHQRAYVIQSPQFFPDLPDTFDGLEATQQTRRVKSAGLSMPYSVISTVSYDRQVSRQLLASVGYTWQRGVQLLRLRNINAPEPQSGALPFADEGPILQYETTGISNRHELRLSLRTNLGSRLSFFGNYILSSTRSDTEGVTSLPANSYDLSNEYGPAGFDQRHRFFLGGSIALPWRLRVSPFIFAASDAPFNITTGRDNNGDSVFTDRPAFANPGDPGAITTRFGTFNPNPAAGDVIIPRNYGQGQGQVSVNLSFSKSFAFGAAASDASGFPPMGSSPPSGGGPMPGSGPAAGGMGGPGGPPPPMAADASHRYRMTLSLNAQNLLNHTNLAGLNTVLISPSFGLANRSLNARKIDLSVMFSF